MSQKINEIHTKKHFILPDAQRVLVFAPHMDDESIGCGGALLMYGNIGCELSIVFMTNGKKDYLKDTSSVREDESLNAKNILRAKNITIFDLFDNSLQLTEELIERIYNQITYNKPDIIFAPHLNDLHHDHLVTGMAVTEALRRKGGGKIAYYEIWNPIPNPNCYINITKVINQKIKLIKCYQSQLKRYNLLKLILALNSYRAAMFQLKQFRFAEAFLLQSIEDITEDNSLIFKK